MKADIQNIFSKAFAFIATALVGMSCYAFFGNQSIDCSKDLSCIKLTTTLVEKFTRENLDGQKIKERKVCTTQDFESHRLVAAQICRI
jgi:hypothetical protein